MTVQNSRLVDSDPIAVLPKPGHRRPCRCSRARPCQTVVELAAALHSTTAALVAAEAAVEALQVPAAASCSLAGVEPCTWASAGTRWRLVASSRNSAEAGMAHSKVLGHKPEAEMMAHA